MRLTDPVADMLARIRNAIRARHQKVDVPASKLKVEIARILKEEGYIANYKPTEEGGHKVIRVYLKYGSNNEAAISNVEQELTNRYPKEWPTDLAAAYLARGGLTGARGIFEGPQGMAAGMSTDADPTRLTDRLGTRWALAETSFKFHASCRHTHPAADALLSVMTKERLKADQVAHVTARVHKGAIDVLGPVTDPQTVHQSKFSMGTVLGLIAVHGRAALTDFDKDFRDPKVVSFRDRVTMELDSEVDGAYPARWIGKVTVETTDGRRLDGRVDVPKGDPDNTLSRPELEDKAVRLGTYRGGATEAEMRVVIRRAWGLASAPKLDRFLA